MGRWTPYEDRYIRRAAAYRTAKQMARVLGRTPNAVHQRAYLLKVPLQKAGDRDSRTKYPDEVVEAARAMHEEGAGPKAIARDLGVPEGSVRSFIYYRGRAGASLVLLAEDRA